MYEFVKWYKHIRCIQCLQFCWGFPKPSFTLIRLKILGLVISCKFCCHKYGDIMLPIFNHNIICQSSKLKFGRFEFESSFF